MYKSKENSFSIKSNNNRQNQFQNIRPLKTPKYNITKDIQIQFFEIFKSMKREVDQSFPAMPKKVDLSSSEKVMRSNLIIEIKNFINKYKLSQTCYYSSIYLLDKLLAKKIKLKIYEIGIASLILSAKFYDSERNLPSINKFQEILKSNQKMSLSRIFEIEIFCLNKLNYKMTSPETYNFINIILMYGIIFNTDSNKRKLNSYIYHLPLQIYDEIIYANTDYLQFHPLLLAYSCIAISRDIYKLDKWIPLLEKVFNISFYDFEEVYQFVYDLYKECKEKENKQKHEEEIMSNLNINNEINKKNTFDIKTEKNNKVCNNTIDINQRKIMNKQDSNEYILKSAQKYNLIRNPSETTLKNYIHKTQSMKINIDIKQLENIMKSKQEIQKQLNKSYDLEREEIKKKDIEFNKRNSFLNENKFIKPNLSYSNYNQQLKIDSNINNENDEKENEMFFYNPIKKTNLSEYTSNKTKFISAVTRAKLSFLKTSKSNMNFLNKSTKNAVINKNNKSLNISFNDSNNSFDSFHNNSFQEKQVNNHSKNIILPIENNNISKLNHNNRYKYLFINKK